ncbi:MAG: Chromosome partition protein MukF [Sodalis sp.]|uniref:hypothetical protein n=1 Tax=Sodalis sp. (in: enterobacteria) TaxID=1898979 RepID=UPI003872DCC8|nr:MAG: Chromosome partition protein MukF [Sodalis sp.]WMQ73742.1 MAG: Chromosome partition protein MukF [Sodalis sp.]
MQLVDAFRYVSGGLEQTQETVSVRVNNATNDLVRQRLLNVLSASWRNGTPFTA